MMAAHLYLCANVEIAAYDFVNGKLLKFNIYDNNKIFGFGVFFSLPFFHAASLCVPLALFAIYVMAIERVREAEAHSTSANDMVAYERPREKKKKMRRALAIRLITWYENMGWYAHKHIQTASGLLLLLLLPLQFILSSFFLFCWLHKIRLCAHAFLTIYVLYFLPFFNFLSSNASLVFQYGTIWLFA